MKVSIKDYIIQSDLINNKDLDKILNARLKNLDIQVKKHYWTKNIPQGYFIGDTPLSTIIHPYLNLNLAQYWYVRHRMKSNVKLPVYKVVYPHNCEYYPIEALEFEF